MVANKALAKRERVAPPVITLDGTQFAPLLEVADQRNEEAVIGAVLQKPELYIALAEILQPSDFFFLVNGYIWKAFDDLSNAGQGIDLITVPDAMQTIKAPIEGEQLIRELARMIGAAPDNRNAETYARAVFNSALRLRLLFAAEGIHQIARDKTKSIESVIDECDKVIYKATNRKSESNSSILSAMAAYADKVEAKLEAGELSPGIPLGSPRLDKKLGGLYPGEVCVLAGGEGMGKCLAKGTEVLRYDGTLAKVETLKIGDVLMGADSTPRKIVSLGHGTEQMYWVHQNRAMSYKVNASHILSLKHSGTNGGYAYGEVVNISVRDWLQKNKKFKQHFMGYKVSVEFPNYDTLLPPYFMGLWLGDGASESARITTNDSEIVQYLNDLALERGEYVSMVDSHGTRCPSYTVTNGSFNHDSDTLRRRLRLSGVLNNKHIPQEYLVNSRENRMLLLAGLIDSDGHYQPVYNTYEITTTIEELANQIKFLVDSLGFKTSLMIKDTSCQNGFIGTAYRVRFSGDCTEIPVLIERKKARKPATQKDWHVTGIKIEDAGEGEFYGFELDGDGLFLLKDMTVTHNTTWALSHLRNVAKTKRKAVLFTLEMTQEEILRIFSAMETGIYRSVLKSFSLSSYQWGLFTKASGEIGSWNLDVVDEFPTLTPIQCRRKLRTLAQAGDIELVVIDGLWLMEADEPSKDRWRDVTIIMRELNQVARDFQVPILITHQYSGQIISKPTLYDLSESAGVRRNAQVVLGLHRPSPDDEGTESAYTDIYSLKDRNGSSTGEKVEYVYMDSHNLYKEMGT